MTLHIHTSRLVLLAAATALSGAMLPLSAHALSRSAAQPEAGPAMGIVYARGNNALNAGAVPFARRNPDMTYHGGVIMPTYTSKAIFWGTSWAHYAGDVITGIDSFYTGLRRLQLCKDLGRVHRKQRSGRRKRHLSGPCD